MSPLFRTRRSTRPTRKFATHRLNLTKKPNVRMMLQPLEERQVPAIFTVTDGGDSGLPNQLRQILAVCNSNAESDTVNFDPGVTSVSLVGTQLPAYSENFNLTINGNGIATTTIFGTGGAARIATLSSGTNTTININDIKLTGGSVTGAGGAINVTTALTLNLNNVDMSGNTASGQGGALYLGTSTRVIVSGSTFQNNQAGSFGGAMSFFSSGQFVVANSTFSGNLSKGTGTTYGGGAIYMFSGTGGVISNSTFSSNSAVARGGAIIMTTGPLLVQNTTFSNNSAGVDGGAIRTGGVLTSISNTFSGNTATTAGGAISSSSTILVGQSIFSGNTAGTTGGGIYSSSSAATVAFSQFEGNFALTSGSTTGTVGGGGWRATGGQSLNNTFSGNTATAMGGAIFNGTNAMTIAMNTITGNTASGTSSLGAGGGIFNNATASVTINNSTIVDNTATANKGGGVARSAGTVTINSSIIALNKLGVDTTGFDLFASAATTSGGNNNIIGTKDNSNFTLSGAGNQVGTDGAQTDPLLNALADNGGFYTLPGGGNVKTMSLKTGSPALDLGNNSAGFGTDQRGANFRRVVGLAADVGAYEAITLSAIPDARLSLGDVTAAGSGAATITVVYTDNTGVNTGNFDGTDLTVTGPNSFSQAAAFTSFTGSGTSVTATYTVAAPSGGWGGVNTNNQLNIGNYTVTMNASQVGDGVNSVPTGSLGTFKTDFGLALQVSSAGDATTGFVYNSGALTFRAAMAAVTANQAFAPNKVSTITFDTTTMGGSTVTLVSVSPAAIAVGAATSATAQVGPNLGVIIQGTSPGSHIQIKGSSATNHLVVADGYNVTISNMDFTGFAAASVTGSAISFGNDNVTISNSSFTSNTTTGTGGAVNVAGSLAVLSNALLNTNTATGVALSGAQYRNTNTISLSTVTFTNNSATTGGGGIQLGGTFSTITIDSGTFTTNTGSVGAAVRVSAANTVVNISKSVFSGNTSTGTGGALYTGGLATLTNNVFSSNSAASNGGAIRLQGGGIVIRDSVFSGNRSNISTVSSGGGAVYSASTLSALITNSTFSGNTAGLGATTTFNSSGGAMLFSGTVAGGASTLGTSGSFAIRQVTVSGNTATGATTAAIGGGGIRWASSSTIPLALQNSTIANNAVSSSTVGTGGGVSRSAGAVNMESNIVSGNTVAGAAANGNDVFGAASMTVNFTAIGNSTGFTPLGNTGNQLGSPVSLLALANNGGFTLPDGSTIQTRKPGGGSPVRGSGSNPASLTLDQRGATFPRLIGLIDMGAIETDDPTPIAKIFSAPTQTVAGAVPYTFQIEYDTTFAGGIDSTTFGLPDITVTGTGYGGGQNPTVLGAIAGGPTSYTVTYTIPAPAGGWGGSNIGAYTISVNAGQVINNAPDLSPITGSSLGTFGTAISTTLLVDLESDVDDGNYSLNNLTLREALKLTNGNIAPDTITFKAANFTGTPIVLASTYNITDNVVISGPGKSLLVLSGNNAVQVFNISIAGVGTVSMNGMTITKGKGTSGAAVSMDDDSVTISNTDMSLNTASSGGGAITLTSATLSLSNVNFSKNTATGAGGAINATGAASVTVASTTFDKNTASGAGGAVSLSDVGSTFSATKSTFSNNTSASTGGAISTSGAVSVTTTDLTTNTASSHGGAVFLATPNSGVSISFGSVSGNTAGGTGGGISGLHVAGAPIVNIDSSLVSGNKSAAAGGGVYFFDDGTMTVSNSTFTGNSASGSGGAFYLFELSGSTYIIRNSTIVGNTASSGGGIFGGSAPTVTLDSTIVAQNFGPAANSAAADMTGVTFTGNVGNNLIGIKNGTINGTDSFGTTGSPLDPLINPLAANGGPTQTMSLKGSSPAVGTGNNFSSLTFDQRGTPFARSLGGLTDVGAWQTQISPEPRAKMISSPDVTSAGLSPEVIQIQYFDLDGGTIDSTTFGIADVSVTGNGYGSPTSPTSFSILGGGGSSWTVQYTFPAPSGGWGSVNIGAYTVTMNATQVSDLDDGLFVATGSLGTFKTAFATTLTVDENSDVVDGNFGANKLSLREALNLTNANGGADTINFGGAAFAAPATITLTSGLTISDSVRINGKGADKLTVDANKTGRHFTTGTNESITLTAMTLTGGSAAGGGSILVGAGTSVTLDGMWLKTNVSSGIGGAISIDTAVSPTTAALTIKNSTISGNSGSAGGGVYFLRGLTMVVSNSTLSGNTASGSGGAVGGYTTSSGSVVVHNSTITGNKAGTGGAFRFTPAAYSAGILNLESSIVAGNLGPSTTFDIQSFDVTSTNSIIGSITGAGTLIDLGGTVSGDATTPVNAKLDVLANYGGPTPTHRLQLGSPAINAGSNPDTLTFDQRGSGFPRSIGVTDMGSYELAAILAPQAKLLTAPDVTSAGFADETITVQYFEVDGGNIDTTTFGTADVSVTGGLYVGSVNANSFSVVGGSGGDWTVQYTFPAPPTGWGSVNIGAFTVSMNAGQVLDDDQLLPVAAGSLGTFKTAFATTLTVSEASDVVDGNYGAGKLSLREAIGLTNGNLGNDTINFSLTFPATITLGTELKLTDSTQIDGPGAGKLQIKGTAGNRLFETAVAHVYNFNNVELTGGSVAGNGGAILLGKGDTITLDKVWIHGNTATGLGGALSPDTSESPSTASVTIKNSTISGNSASTGGAVYFLRGMTLTILQSTISSNTAGTAGAIGGFTTDSGTVTLHNTTVTGNTASTGGAFRFTPAAYSVGILNLESSIVSGNKAGTDPDIQDFGTASINSKNSLIGVISVAAVNDLGGSILNTPALLTGLGFFGGVIPTHVQNAGSPTLETGSDPDTIIPGNDQRGTGFPRLVGTSIDMGATEGVNSIPQASYVAPPNFTTPGSSTFAVNGQASVTVTVIYTDNSQVLSGTVGTSDVTLSGPGYGSPQSPSAFTTTASGASVTATYTFLAPGGTWDSADNGTYSLNMKGTEVSDNADSGPTLFVQPGVLGSFKVGIGKTYLVDELSDTDDSITTTGNLSLREAVRLANTVTTGTTDTINFAGNVTGTLTMGGAEYAITEGLIINGPGSGKLTIDANNGRRIFNNTTTDDVTIGGLTVTKGLVALAGSTGGAIQTAAGKLTLNDMVVSSSGAAADGGGIAVNGGGFLIVNDSTIKNNQANVASTGAQGGGIFLATGGKLEMHRSTVSGNAAGEDGGGIYFFSGGSLLVDSSTISGNLANITGTGAGGGGIYFFGTASSFKITNSTISGNTADGDGGGISLQYSSGTFQVHNSTITGNLATGLGGGVYSYSYYGNTIQLGSSIIAGNLAGAQADISLDHAENIGGDNNLVGVADVGNFTLTGTGNLTGTAAVPLDAKLDALGNYGGPTQTHRLQPISPAFRTGNNADSLTFDQRGAPHGRSNGASLTDMGAYQVPDAPTVTSVFMSDGSSVAVTQRSLVKQIVVTFSEAVNFSGPVANAFTLFRSLASLSAGPNANVGLVAAPVSGPASSVTITFTGALTTFGSLIDGLYDFTIDAAQISGEGGNLDGNGDFTGGDSKVIIGSTSPGPKFFRLFGDFDGDGQVTTAPDFIQFRNAFGAGPSLVFDYQNSGDVDTFDFIEFRNRFGATP